MTHTTPSRLSRNATRALLIESQRTNRSALALPPLLHTPVVILLWGLTLATVVCALALGRIHVPRVVHGVVVASPADSLTPLLLLRADDRRFVTTGQLAMVHAGGERAMALQLRAPASLAVHGDTSTVAVALERCHGSECLTLTRDARYPATATLGTRTLASFAFPRS